jgi:SAM-dependent methyltransferase
MQGTAGYQEQASTLVEAYESVTLADVYGPALAFLPTNPVQAADIGAGTGRDAAALARLGHAVTAVEPVAAFRDAGRGLHQEPLDWVDDGLPALAHLDDRGPFGLILLTAVLMHMDAPQREASLARLTELLHPGGRLFLTLRHGPVPAGRTMYEVSVEEMTNVGAQHGLVLLHASNRSDVFARVGVSWDVIVLEKRA